MNKTLEECYRVLGVDVNSTPEEVKRAYKTQALACHPDKNPDDPGAVKKFQELGYAYKKITAGKMHEEGEESEDLFSRFDYWLKVFFYCMFEDRLISRRHNRYQHWCNNANGDSDEDDDDDYDDEYCYRWKHREKYKEETFTKEEMKRFVKFNSLEEQREFNKKIFCKSKKATKKRKEPQIQKPKGKSNKQLKAEEWKRQKEISKIAEEIEMKRKQKEEKLEQPKVFLLKTNKEDKSSERPLIQEANGEPPKEVNLSSVHKVKSKKAKKRGRAKNGTWFIKNNSNKSCQQPEIPPVSVTRKVSETGVSHTKPKEPVQNKKTSNTTISPAHCRNVSKSVAAPVNTAPQPPNIWQKRMATEIEIQQMLPSNEEEELKQLQMALEMSRNLAEIEKQQRQIVANVQSDLQGFGSKGSKNQEQNIDTRGNDDSSCCPQNASNNTCESDSQYQETKAQPSTLKSKGCLGHCKEKRICPFGRNCCLGKSCTKFHPSSKRSKNPVENRIQGDLERITMKSITSCHESEFLNDRKNSDQEEVWDNDFDNNECDHDKVNKKITPDTALNICHSKVPCFVQNHSSVVWDFQHEGLNTDYACGDSEYGDSAPVSSKIFDLTKASTENWYNELKECEHPNNAMKMGYQQGDEIPSSPQNIEENKVNLHPYRSINEVGKGFKTEGIGQMSAGTPGNYIPTYPIIAHPAVNTSINGGIGPAQPSEPVFGMDILSGLSPTGHLSQTNQVINPVNHSAAGQAPPTMTGSLTGQNLVLPPSGTTLFPTVSGQGVFHPGNIFLGNRMHSGTKGPSHVQIPGSALSSDAHLSKNEKSISGKRHQTCPNTIAQTAQTKSTLSECDISQGTNQAYEPQLWSNARPVNPANPSQLGSNLPIPGLSIPVLQNMNPMLSPFPSLPVLQQNTIPNTFDGLSAPKVQNPPLMGLPCSVSLANGDMNYVSLMALEAQYLNTLQRQSLSMATNQYTKPCEDSTLCNPCVYPNGLENHIHNSGSSIRKPVTVPKVLSFVESQS